MYEKFLELLEFQNTTPYKVAKATGIATSTLSDWKNGKSTPKQDKLNLIANYFKVPPNYFTNSDLNICPYCGFNIEMPEIPTYHAIQHAKWKDAVSKYGFCWPYPVCENTKHICCDKLSKNEDTLTTKLKIDLQTEIFKALFSRSLRSVDFDLSHPQFNDFVAMLLNQEQFKNKIASELYANLKEIYGVKSGIEEGSTYFKVSKEKAKDTSLQFEKRDERDIEKILSDTLDKLQNQQQSLMFNGEALDDETRELLEISLENSIRIAKANAKQKFTPKKYRKS